jgi:c-di-GMP-binding flagellar brake protein YcgR
MSTLQVVQNYAAAALAERRRFQRLRAAIQIEIRVDGSNSPIRAETSDISVGGCYVEMAMTMDKGSDVQVTLWFDNQKLVTRGRVVTKHPQFGNGIEFTGISRESQDRLSYFVDGEAMAPELLPKTGSHLLLT